MHAFRNLNANKRSPLARSAMNHAGRYLERRGRWAGSRCMGGSAISGGGAGWLLNACIQKSECNSFTASPSQAGANRLGGSRSTAMRMVPKAKAFGLSERRLSRFLASSAARALTLRQTCSAQGESLSTCSHFGAGRCVGSLRPPHSTFAARPRGPGHLHAHAPHTRR